MRLVVVAILVAAGCSSNGGAVDDADLGLSTPDLKDPRDLALRRDLTPAPDLAWTDLAGGVDIAEAPVDLAEGGDMRQVQPRDMAQAVDMIPSCVAAYGCTCGARNFCNTWQDCCSRSTTFSTQICSNHSCCHGANADCWNNADCCSGICKNVVVDPMTGFVFNGHCQ